MSIQTNFPAIRPSLNLDFANTKELDPRITYTRASTASYYGTQTAKAEENLLIRSQDFDAVSWEKFDVTLLTNFATAPDGTTTAENISETPVTNRFMAQQAPTLLAGTRYVYSLFVRDVDVQYVILELFGVTSNYAWAEFDLSSTGSVNRSGAAGTGWILNASSITASSNGYFRVFIDVTIGATVTTPRARIMLSDGVASIGASGVFVYTGTNKSVDIWGAQLEQRSAVTAYTPTTTQAITNYIPVLETAASGVARFDHNPTTFESLGFLVEEQRTNLFTYSSEFDNAAWTKTRSSITENTIVSPDGTLTADKHIPNTESNANHNLQRVNLTVGATQHALSLYAKQGEYSFVEIGVIDSGSYTKTARQTFNLSTGSVGNKAEAGGYTVASASITPVGNGWYRCILVTSTLDANSTTRVEIQGRPNNAASTAYTGDGYSGLYVWGAQLEAGAFPTSYIPTVASQVTRAADAASMTGVNFSSWYNAGEGALYVDWAVPSSTASCNIFSISDGTTNNRYQQYSESGSIVLRTAASGVAANNSIGASIANTFIKTAFGYGSGSTSASDNGTAVTTTTQNLPSTLTAVYIGGAATGAVGQGVTIRKIAFYPKRLSNTELQGLTS